MSADKVIEQAKADLGYTEYPANSNMTKYGEWYGMNGQPWCVMSLAFWFNEAGERMAFFGGGKTASCGMLLRWYREQGLVVDKKDIQIGDILIFNFSGTKDAQHCGLVVDKGKLAGTWYTIEGNTTPGEEGSQDDGGCVALKMRSVRNVVGVCRPQYKDEEPEDDITGHWAEDDIRWCMEHGFMQGYPDGSFQPDKPVTRAELATVIRRLVEM